MKFFYVERGWSLVTFALLFIMAVQVMLLINWGEQDRMVIQVLYLYGEWLIGHVSKEMKEYCKTD